MIDGFKKENLIKQQTRYYENEDYIIGSNAFIRFQCC